MKLLHPTRFFLFSIMAFLFISSCGERMESGIKYNELTEAQKRLPENALASMDVAEGLKVSLFASEPEVMNPTNMAIDARGRIWICEGRNYRLFANPANTYDDKGDRILILEDTDGDGTSDTSKVFYQGEDVNAALGIAVLGNRVIVSVSPNVIVFTDEDGDDVPDSRELLFSGIEGVDHDHGVHAFVFGPDGRLYFNFGNSGNQLLDKEGKQVIDIYGNPVVADGHPFREGMAFRCEPDGSGLEVLGYNFRNPYELAVDSYGGLWQSDNDDDGNRGTRINFLMEYGNYGFKDQVDGSSWQERRLGWEDEIPERHWHLNDPGTVPNLLQTGAGSPCGILVYETDVLPEIYRNELIHCEPGHNVVRSYAISEKRAGYTAAIHNLMASADNWFRPSDVAVAPDGSLFVCDWYDGGVGGHKAEDIARGRIYHIEPDAPYPVADYDLTTPEGAAKGLLSDNMDVFYQSWQKLHTMGVAAEPLLEKLMDEGNAGKPRALWLAAKIPGRAAHFVDRALHDMDKNIRMQGIRMARYLVSDNLVKILQPLVNDPEAGVRRELAIALRNLGTPGAAEMWAALARKHKAGDRWSLEALGIGSDIFPDLYFAAWRKSVGKDQSTPAGKEIIWRSRAKASVALLTDIIRDPATRESEWPSYFRAFHFKVSPDKNTALLSLLAASSPLSQLGKAYAMGQLEPDFVMHSRNAKDRIHDLLPDIEGSPEWLLAVKKFGIPRQDGALFRLASGSGETGLREEAMGVLIDRGGGQMVEDFLSSDQPDPDKMHVLGTLSGIGNDAAVDLLAKNLESGSWSRPLQQKLVEALGNTWPGQHRLFQLMTEGKIPADLKTAAALKLMTSWDEAIRQKAPGFLDTRENDLPDMDMLVEKDGDPLNGKSIFETYCSTCHVVGGSGTEFGPELTDIGTKLSKNFLYSAIIYPSAGINFGYEGYQIRLKDGSTLVGYILGKTEDRLTLRMMGNNIREIPTADIERMEAMDKSLMTEGLYKVMGEQDLVDLVTYLSTLKIAI